MANAQTKHSRDLRSRTAAERNALLRKEGKMSQYTVSGAGEFIQAQKEALADVPGKSYTEKIQFLLENKK